MSRHLAVRISRGLESNRRYARVMGGVLRVSVAKVVLDEAEVVALVREVESAGVAKRVRVNAFQVSPFGCSAHGVADRLSSKRVSAFAEKEPRQLAISLPQVPLDCTKLVDGNWLLDGQAVLQSPDPETRLLEVYVSDLQSDGFAHTQAVTVDHQEQEVVADAMPPPLGGLQQPLDFRFVEEILLPFVEVSGRCA